MRYYLGLVLSLFAVAAVCGQVSANTILFESGTLGPTGIPYSELINQNVPGTNVHPSVFSGVRFQLNKPAQTTQVGGHFVSGIGGTFFGAIVKLDDQNDFPNSTDPNAFEAEVLGHTLLNFPTSSAEVFGDLDLELDPGWYTLVFGSGIFGATGAGVTVRNSTDIGNPTYIGLQPDSIFGWVNRLTSVNRRHVVKGRIVPEPTTILSMALCFPCLSIRRRSRKKSYGRGAMPTRYTGERQRGHALRPATVRMLFSGVGMAPS